MGVETMKYAYLPVPLDPFADSLISRDADDIPETFHLEVSKIQILYFIGMLSKTGITYGLPSL